MPVLTTPIEIARETLRLLTTRRVPPTPENYRQLYYEIAGEAGPVGGAAERALARMVADLPRGPQHLARAGEALDQAVSTQDWQRCGTLLSDLLKAASAQAAPAEDWAALLRDLMRQMEAHQSGLTVARKKELLDRALAAGQDGPPAALHQRLRTLVQGWAQGGESQPLDIEVVPIADAAAPLRARVEPTLGPPAAIRPDPNDATAVLRDFLAKTLEYGVASQLGHLPDLRAETEAVAERVRGAMPETLGTLTVDLKRLWYKLEIRGSDGAEQQEGLLRLLRLTLDNVGQLLDDDRWLHGQVAVIQEILSSQLNLRGLEEAERRLKEVIYKQGGLKHSLTEAKSALKNLIAAFIERLAELSASTGDYSQKISTYSERITGADGIDELSAVVDEILRETDQMQASTAKSHGEMEQARQMAQEADAKIRALETELEQMSLLVSHDQLTGSLNRRGLDEAYNREAARADRRRTPLCLAIIDIDNFKTLNDEHGHQAGDGVLAHLVRVVKDTVRPNDVVARFGGEEFCVLLPDTLLDDAVIVVARLQRELTRQAFLYEQKKILVTFSAGVAQRLPDEDQGRLLERADRALYKAKKAGKNQVCASPMPAE